MDEVQSLKDRIKQLEAAFERESFLAPPKPDPDLAEDEWYAIFSDYRDLSSGSITKYPWRGGNIMTAVFKVKRIL